VHRRPVGSTEGCTLNPKFRTSPAGSPETEIDTYPAEDSTDISS
jgi:hypothetical protein